MVLNPRSVQQEVPIPRSTKTVRLNDANAPLVAKLYTQVVGCRKAHRLKGNTAVPYPGGAGGSPTFLFGAGPGHRLQINRLMLARKPVKEAGKLVPELLELRERRQLMSQHVGPLTLQLLTKRRRLQVPEAEDLQALGAALLPVHLTHEFPGRQEISPSEEVDYVIEVPGPGPLAHRPQFLSKHLLKPIAPHGRRRRESVRVMVVYVPEHRGTNNRLGGGQVEFQAGQARRPTGPW